MRRTLRSIERALVRERAELKTRAVIDTMLLRWDEAVDGDNYWGYELEFVRRLGWCGIYPWAMRALDYLSKCRVEGDRPDPDRLLSFVVP